ncbi:MAG: M23 family metallopeptidase [Pseudomonadota bacterium]|nr:M23 family metallopeptidase [Pseudomonadota bacterium]MEC8807930.1 M23 family metallopeptidase [Pseudomonadota bacterium]
MTQIVKPQSLMSLVISFALLIGLALPATTAFANATSVPGGVYAWSVPAGASDIRFQNNPVFVVGQTALVGIPIRQALGPAQITFVYGGQDQTHTFEIVDKRYTEQRITLQNKEMVSPNPKQLERIRAESKRQRAIYATVSAPMDLSTGFSMPLEGITTSLYGHRRFFNDQPRSPHSGLDIAAPTGTPIVAPAQARVALVDDLYYNGKSVFLDHGQGLITMYCHLSEQTVSTGELVQQDQVIGLVGATGRVTGPHLHWSVSLNGYRIDPLAFREALAIATSVSP